VASGKSSIFSIITMTLRVGEEVELLGLQAVEHNGKRGWIVRALMGGRYGVWLGDPQAKPISVRSECATAVSRTPLDPLLSKAVQLSTAKQIKRALNDNIERPLAALLGRLSNPANFPTEALQMPRFVVDIIKWLVEQCMQEYTYSFTSTFNFNNMKVDGIDKFKLLYPGEEPVIAFRFDNLREFRKAMVASLPGDADALPFSGNIMSILPLSGVIKHFSDVSFACHVGVLRSISSLRQLPAAAGRNLIGALTVLRLDDFATTALTDTFLCTDIFDADGADPDTVLSRQLRRLVEASWTPARESAVREFNELIRRLDQLGLTFDKCRDFCQVCHLSAYPLRKPELPLEKCAGCRMVWYCGKDHQREHWTVHKPHCKELCGYRARKKELISIINAPAEHSD
jgi:hypothetical protein